MNKKLILIIAIILLGSVFVFLQKDSTPKNLQTAEVLDGANNIAQNIDQVSSDQIKIKNPKITFVGYGPAGKSHEVSFQKIQFGDLQLDENKNPVGAKVDFEMSSVSTGIAPLDKHLCSEDFFDCVKFTTAIFNLTKAEKKSDNLYEITGDLTFKGITKSIIFEVNQNGQIFTADFLLSLSQFGINYVGVNDEVRVQSQFEI